MRWATCILAVFSYCNVSFAQNSVEYRTCIQNANTQLAINVCASEEVSRVDLELNEVYQKLQATTAKDPNTIVKITAAEKAWIAYRDAYLEAMYPAANKLAEYGSSFPAESNLLRVKLTQQQIEALRQLLKQHGAQVVLR